MTLIAALDTETTGFIEPDHRIIEVYIDLVDTVTRKRLFTYDQRINPKRNMPAEAQRVHGIAATDLLNKPDWEQVGPIVHKIIEKSSMVVAHNARFDVGFLNMEFERIGLPKISKPSFCTMEHGIWGTPTGKKPSLKEMCFACGIAYDPALAHAASYDVGLMSECLFLGMDWGFYDLAVAA